MSIDTFLKKHGASAPLRPQRSAADKVLAEIAAQAVLSPDAEKLLRTLEYALTHDLDSLRIGMEGTSDATAPAFLIARRLTTIGVLSHVHSNGGQPVLFASISKRCDPEVRGRVAALMHQGRWLEVGTAQVVSAWAEEAGQEIEVATQVRITLDDGSEREIDVFVCVGDEALLVECKAGSQGFDGIGNYSKLARFFGIAPSHTLVLATSLDEQAAADLQAFYPVTVVAREQIRALVERRVIKMVARAAAATAERASHELLPQPPESETEQSVRRQAADSDEIESALITAARVASLPNRLAGLVVEVRDQLNCSRKSVNFCARRLLGLRVFLDQNGDEVQDFGTPIHGVQAGAVAEAEAESA